MFTPPSSSFVFLGGLCESCGQQWHASVPLRGMPRVYCACGRRQVIELLDEFPEHEMPSVN